MIFDTKQIKAVLESQAGKEMKAYLFSRLKDLNDIDNCRECSKAQDQALEFKSQKKAYDKLKEILIEIMEIEEAKKLTENDLKEREKEYGL